MVFDFYTSEGNGDGIVRRSSKKSYARRSNLQLRQLRGQPVRELVNDGWLEEIETPIGSLRMHAIAKGESILADNPFQRNYSDNKVRWAKKRQAARNHRLRNRGE